MVAGQQLEEISSAYFEGGGEEDNGLLHDSDILDMDKAELLLGRDIDIFSSSEAEDAPPDAVARFSTISFFLFFPIKFTRSSRPLSAYRGGRENVC